MRVSLEWLRGYVDINIPPQELAHKLTMAGLEVEGIDIIGGNWDNIVVGQVLAIEPHPDADRLRLATIDLGTEQVKVVCGDLSLQVHANVPFARLGACLIDPHTGEPAKLKRAKIRGVVSEGMACSEKELGISDNHESVMVLPAEAPLGIPLADYLGDAILDVAVTANRPDCLSIIGIAREVAALTGEKVHISTIDYEEKGKAIEHLVNVEIADPDLCRRYCASLIDGVKIAPSPSWMQQTLINSGMRPINNIVDITNYVMLEYGQPLHAFDYRKIGGKKIVVRRAREKERMTTLDNVERTLNPNMLVIADSQVPVALGGVMGGADSEVTDVTTSVLVESANFDPVSIRRTSTSLKLRSEASIRFERGISPELSLMALKRVTQLILELAGGEAARGIIDVYPGKKKVKTISLTTFQFKRLLGIEMEVDRMAESLTSLGFKCQRLTSSELEVSVPYWRVDVSTTADLIEEIARITGYDQIPTTMLSSQLPHQQVNITTALREKLRDLLVGCGFQEIIGYSLTSREKLDKIIPASDPLRLANPMSIEQEYLRTSLRPGLLTTLSSNQKHEDSGIRLFEIGKVYIPREKDLPEEPEILAGVLSGTRTELSWLGEKGWLDFFDAKGVVESLLARIGIEASFEAGEDNILHPGKTAKVMVNHNTVGSIGELHPRVAEAFDLLPQPVVLFELEIDKLLSPGSQGIRFQPLSRFPESVRDIAVIMDDDVPAEKVQSIIRGFPLVNQVSLFDLYRGEQIPPDKKSLAFRIVYQSPTHTLTDKEVDKVEGEILKKLSEETGANLRR